jgi:cytochrome c-type biogenesis protein
MTDVSLLTAGLAGVASFLSPCVLPLVPGYLAYVSGVALETRRRDTGAVEGLSDARRTRLRTVTAYAGAFVLGFTTIFVLLGASATAVGQFLLAYSSLFTKLAGTVMVLFGLHIMGIVPIPLLAREKRLAMRTAPRTLLGAYGVGMLFAFGWTPCIGPILAVLLTMAAVQETVAHGMTLLAVYALGLGVPFLVAALGVNVVLVVMTRFQRYVRAVELVNGVLLIAVDGLVFTNQLAWVSGHLGFLNGFVL